MNTKVNKSVLPTGLNWQPKVEIYSSISDIAAAWDNHGPENIFLESRYLSIVERFPPKGMKPYYIILRNEDGSIRGKVYFQYKVFSAQDSLTVDKTGKCPSFFSALGYYLKELVTSKVEFKALGCGNLMVSGQHAFVFSANTTREEEHYLVDFAIKVLTDKLAEEGNQPSVILMKDFYESQTFATAPALGPKFYEFQVQPNMLLKIRQNWSSIEDYLADMSSKYRVRYKRARKKLNGIRSRVLEYDEIVSMKERMFYLYQCIANGAGFNLFVLSPDYIPELKRVLEDHVKITGYFLEDELVGFTTLVKNNHEVEAHFLGFDDRLIYSHQLFLNMLYDLVGVAIDRGLEVLNFSRTAMEIKSSVGAEPVQLNCYIRHQKSFQNHLLPKLFDFLKPQEEWVQRNPFKT